MRRIILPLTFAVVAAFAMRTDLNGYATNGHAWGTNQVLYYVNPTNNYVSNSAAISAFQNAAYPWSSQSLANIQLVYAGTTNGSSLTNNRKNEVFFRDDSSGYVAETYWWYDGTGHLVDADMVLHENYVFFAGSGCSNGVYIEDVAVHEFGHALGLAHSGAAGATMEPSMPGLCDRTQLTLESDDISGIEALYPPTSTARTAPPSLTVSPDGTTVPTTASQIVDSNGTVWTIGGGGVILANGVQAAGGYGSQIYWKNGAIYVLSGGVWWQWSGSGWFNIGSTAPGTTATSSSLTTSSDGANVPLTASQIVDNYGAVWTIGGGNAILRNGVQAAGGYGSQIYWKSSTIYVLSGTTWWQWTGSGWVNAGSTAPGTLSASANGTMIPTTATQIIDNAGGIWTIGSGYVILRNGVQAAGGYGSKIYWKNSTIYVLSDVTWWKWTGSGWQNSGTVQP